MSRRVIDSLTPGWRQIGAVWLPLPHLLQLLPTQIDSLYRTGAFGSLLSIGCLALTVWAFAHIVLRLTGSKAGAVTSTALLLLNPNLLYLFATPMTEPLLIAALALTILWTLEWLDQPAPGMPLRLGLCLVAAVWTRYEAWPVIASLCLVVALARRSLTAYLGWPVAAVLLFLVNARVSTGAWFVTGGFYVSDPMYAGRVIVDAIGVWWGANELSSYVTGSVALVTATALIRLAPERRQPGLLIPLTFLAASVLPCYALFVGHPFRIRYMVPLVAAYALLCGIAVGLFRPPATAGSTARKRPLNNPAAFATVLLALSLVESPTWSLEVPLVKEATWDVPSSVARRQVRACLAGDYGGELVLASMASLAHLMQELSHDGLDIADFIHEGNGSLWSLALETGPAAHAGWMLVEERSEGGDVLAERIRADAAFTTGMARVCEGGGVALYRRTAAAARAPHAGRPKRSA